MQQRHMQRVCGNNASAAVTHSKVSSGALPGKRLQDTVALRGNANGCITNTTVWGALQACEGVRVCVCVYAVVEALNRQAGRQENVACILK